MRESSLCCGSAGIYNLIRPEMAEKLGDRKAGNVAQTQADEVITANPGCYLQLMASLDAQWQPRSGSSTSSICWTRRTAARRSRRPASGRSTESSPDDLRMRLE